MNIKREDFEKLSKLDRIEFRQRYEMGRVRFSIIDYAFYTMIVMAIFLVGGFYDIASSLLNLVLVIIALEIIGMFLVPMINSSRQSKLEEEYFATSIKSKK